jgi:hypothetical protein
MADSATENPICKLVLVPIDPPGIGYKACLFEADRIQRGIILPVAPFDKLLDQFRDAWGKYDDTQHFILAIADPNEADEQGLYVFGFARLWADKPGSWKTYHFGIPAEQKDSPWWQEFSSLAGQAGRFLPLAAADLFERTEANNSVALWTAFVWALGRKSRSPAGVGRCFYPHLSYRPGRFRDPSN